jgi:ketosteroid isomerase-like protein
MSPHPRAEIEAVVADYVEQRRQIDAGNGKWSDLARFFTDDIVYIDPAHGRVEGLGTVTKWLDDGMVGFEDWKFPIEFAAIEGDDVAIKWTQVFPNGATQSGWTRLIYAGGGKFRYDEDMLNMAHVMEDMKGLHWRPTDGFLMPPAAPNRDFSH